MKSLNGLFQNLLQFANQSPFRGTPLARVEWEPWFIGITMSSLIKAVARRSNRRDPIADFQKFHKNTFCFLFFAALLHFFFRGPKVLVHLCFHWSWGAEAFSHHMTSSGLSLFHLIRLVYFNFPFLTCSQCIRL